MCLGERGVLERGVWLEERDVSRREVCLGERGCLGEGCV